MTQSTQEVSCVRMDDDHKPYRKATQRKKCLLDGYGQGKLLVCVALVLSCYAIVCAQCNIQGTLRFTRKNFNNSHAVTTETIVLPNTAIGLYNSINNQIIGSTYTLSNGNFYYSNVPIDDIEEGMYIIALSQFIERIGNNQISVLNDDNGLYYALTSSSFGEPFPPHTSVFDVGFIDLDLSTSSGAFAIGTTIQKGYDWELNVLCGGNSNILPFSQQGSTTVVWKNDSPPRFNPGSETIYIPKNRFYSSELQRDVFPSHWDDNTILHEFGHFVFQRMQMLEPSAPYESQHDWISETNGHQAWEEGWANFFSVSALGRPNENESKYWDYAVDINPNDPRDVSVFDYRIIDLETCEINNRTGNDPQFNYNTYTDRLSCEGTVAAILWDLVDAHVDHQNGPDQILYFIDYWDDIEDRYSNPTNQTTPTNLWNLLRTYTTNGVYSTQHKIYRTAELIQGWLVRNPTTIDNPYDITAGHNINNGSYPEFWQTLWEHGIRHSVSIIDFRQNPIPTIVINLPTPLPTSIHASSSDGNMTISWEPNFTRFGNRTVKLVRVSQDGLETDIQLSNGEQTQCTKLDNTASRSTPYRYKIQSSSRSGEQDAPSDSPFLWTNADESRPHLQGAPSTQNLPGHRVRIEWPRPDVPQGVSVYYQVYKSRYRDSEQTPLFASGFVANALGCEDYLGTASGQYYSVRSSLYSDGTHASDYSTMTYGGLDAPDLSFSFYGADGSSIPPPGMESAVVVSRVNYDQSIYQENSEVYANHPAYIYWAMQNSGSIATPEGVTIRTRLYINDIAAVNSLGLIVWSRTSPISVGEIEHDRTHYIFTTPGIYRVRVSTDCLENELDINNNEIECTVTVLPDQPDLSFTTLEGDPWSPPNWDAPVILSSNWIDPNDPHPAVNSFQVGQSVNIYWALKNIGPAATPSNQMIQTRLLINGQQAYNNATPPQPLLWWRCTSEAIPIPLESYNYFNTDCGSFVFTQSGIYTIELQTDFENQIDEVDETNNSITVVVNVSMPPLPNLFVYPGCVNSGTQTSLGFTHDLQISDWRDYLHVLSCRDDEAYFAYRQIRVIWYLMSNGELSVGNETASCRLLIDGAQVLDFDNQPVQVQCHPMEINGFINQKDIARHAYSAIFYAPIGNHTMRLEVDYNNSISESNENDNYCEVPLLIRSDGRLSDLSFNNVHMFGNDPAMWTSNFYSSWSTPHVFRNITVGQAAYFYWAFANWGEVATPITNCLAQTSFRATLYISDVLTGAAGEQLLFNPVYSQSYRSVETGIYNINCDNRFEHVFNSPGIYYYKIVLDDGSQVVELDENNNLYGYDSDYSHGKIEVLPNVLEAGMRHVAWIDQPNGIENTVNDAKVMTHNGHYYALVIVGNQHLKVYNIDNPSTPSLVSDILIEPGTNGIPNHTGFEVLKEVEVDGNWFWAIFEGGGARFAFNEDFSSLICHFDFNYAYCQDIAIYDHKAYLTHGSFSDEYYGCALTTIIPNYPGCLYVESVGNQQDDGAVAVSDRWIVTVNRKGNAIGSSTNLNVYSRSISNPYNFFYQIPNSGQGCWGDEENIGAIAIEADTLYATYYVANGSYVSKYVLGDPQNTSPVSQSSTISYFSWGNNKIQEINIHHSFAYASDQSYGLSMIKLDSWDANQPHLISQYHHYNNDPWWKSEQNDVFKLPSLGEYVLEGVSRVLPNLFDPNGQQNSIRILKISEAMIYSPDGGETLTSLNVPITWNGYGTQAGANESVRFFFYPNFVSWQNSRPEFWRSVTDYENDSYENVLFRDPNGEPNQLVYWRTTEARIASWIPSTGHWDISDGNVTVDINEIGGSLSTNAIILSPMEIQTDDTLKVSPTARIKFKDHGKIIVNGVLQFTGRDENSGENDQACLSGGDPDWPISGTVIEIQPGGKVIGKHVKFDGLPTAIEVADGAKVFLDSAEFIGCTTGILATSLTDTVAVSNSSFNGGNQALMVYGSETLESYLSLRSCDFSEQTIEAINLYKVNSGLIEGCTITGDGTSKSDGIELLQCPDAVHINHTTITSHEVGVNSLYSNARFQNDIVTGNIEAGFVWSNDFPGESDPGKLDHCTISDNGIAGVEFQSGFYGYACSPIFTCNQFSGNHFAVYLQGQASPSFYDPENSKAGVNDFSGIEGYPMVVIDDASPVFYYGENAFHGMLDKNGIHLNLYMQLLSAPLVYDLKMNQIVDDPNPIEGFEPPDENIWLLDGPSSGSVCGENLGNYMSSLGGQLLRGDIFFNAEMLTEAYAAYMQALQSSGDSTMAGATALERLSELNPELPPVTDAYNLTKLYNASYGYDALFEFLTADAYRDSILAYGDGEDSLRIKYDLLVSGYLRPGVNKSGDEQSTAGSLHAESERMLMLGKLSKPISKHNPRTTNDATPLPSEYALHPVYPNPFNSITNIRFDLPEANRVKVSVYDAMGRLVTNLVDGNQAAGYHNVQWNGTINSSGVYFVTVHTNKYTATRKAVLLK